MAFPNSTNKCGNPNCAWCAIFDAIDEYTIETSDTGTEPATEHPEHKVEIKWADGSYEIVFATQILQTGTTVRFYKDGTFLNGGTIFYTIVLDAKNGAVAVRDLGVQA